MNTMYTNSNRQLALQLAVDYALKKGDLRLKVKDLADEWYDWLENPKTEDNYER
jgi:hypothetical protein